MYVSLHVCVCIVCREDDWWRENEEIKVYSVPSSYSLHLTCSLLGLFFKYLFIYSSNIYPSNIATSCRLSPSASLPPCYFRQTTQDAPEEVRNRDFRRELEERERVAAREKNRDRPTRGKTSTLTRNNTSVTSHLQRIPCYKVQVADSMSWVQILGYCSDSSELLTCKGMSAAFHADFELAKI